MSILDDDAEVCDPIGPWTELKLEIIRKYAEAYTTVLSRGPLTHHYIDAFSGGGLHRSRRTGELVLGSPAVALQIQPPFAQYHFIDLDEANITALRARVLGWAGDGIPPERIHCYNGDCNQVLLAEVFPRVRYEDFRRALCLLDPFGLDLSWEVIAKAAAMRSVEILLNFPIHDANRNALPRDPSRGIASQQDRLTKLWGDESWKDVAYSGEGNLFGQAEKTDHPVLAAAFRERLMSVAGFKHVPKPVLFRNTRSAPMFYLFFGTHNDIGGRIARSIFQRYRT